MTPAEEARALLSRYNAAQGEGGRWDIPLAGALAAKPIARSALLAAIAGTTPDPVTVCAKAGGANANDRHAARSRLL